MCDEQSGGLVGDVWTEDVGECTQSPVRPGSTNNPIAGDHRPHSPLLLPRYYPGRGPQGTLVDSGLGPGGLPLSTPSL